MKSAFQKCEIIAQYMFIIPTKLSGIGGLVGMPLAGQGHNGYQSGEGPHDVVMRNNYSMGDATSMV